MAGRVNRLWSFVNSQFGFWLLTTISVGVISGTYAQYQTCIAEFEQGSQKFWSLTSEIFIRDAAFFDIMSRAKNDDDLRSALKDYQFGGDFYYVEGNRRRTVFDISSERTNLYQKLLPVWYESKNVSHPVPRIIAVPDYPQFRAMMKEVEQESSDFSTVRYAANDWGIWAERRSGFLDVAGHWNMQPRCGVVPLWRRMLGLLD